MKARAGAIRKLGPHVQFHNTERWRRRKGNGKEGKGGGGVWVGGVVFRQGLCANLPDEGASNCKAFTPPEEQPEMLEQSGCYR
ncbi:hypothetical protein BaRGS_00003426 [Batillaria attramentaria]|uniref:Uncharacterized protein n=1 Tax=Batillaria attramentaria TaxID=370345 RepID=A0ABD0LZZ9_9CAEN